MGSHDIIRAFDDLAEHPKTTFFSHYGVEPQVCDISVSGIYIYVSSLEFYLSQKDYGHSNLDSPYYIWLVAQ